MAKPVGSKAESKRKRQKSRSIPLEQVSPAVLTATRDVAYMLEQLCIYPGPEDVLKAVLDRAEHLEEQASGITLLRTNGRNGDAHIDHSRVGLLLDLNL